MTRRLFIMAFYLVVAVYAMAQDSPQTMPTTAKEKAKQIEVLETYILGIDSYLGDGVPQDFLKAVSLFRKAADQGLADAQNSLGDCYATGKGVTQDYIAAVLWYRKAADQGLADAQYRLGYCYAEGKGIAQNYTAAASWYRKAADQGLADAQYNLGGCYAEGEGVARDHAVALSWFRMAAEQGLDKAQLAVGICCSDGRGTTQDYEEAVFWYSKAAEQGLARAQVLLGFCYRLGQGVTQDYVQAHMWFNLAAARGSNEIADFRADLECIMTAEQIAEAQSMAREWKPVQDANAPSEKFADTVPDRENPKSSGTGFYVSFSGHVLTAAHVVQNAEVIYVCTKAGTQEARIVSTDKLNDLAILKTQVQSPPPALPLRVLADMTNAELIDLYEKKSGRKQEKVSDPSTDFNTGVRMGDTVFTLGFPNIGLQGLKPKLTKGEISSLTGIRDDPRYYQISVAVQPGNSGGPLVDEKGEVVGVVISRLGDAVALEASGMLPQQVNYAVKISHATSLLNSIPDCGPKQRAKPITAQRPFADVVQDVEVAVCLILTY